MTQLPEVDEKLCTYTQLVVVSHEILCSIRWTHDAKLNDVRKIRYEWCVRRTIYNPKLDFDLYRLRQESVRWNLKEYYLRTWNFLLQVLYMRHADLTWPDIWPSLSASWTLLPDHHRWCEMPEFPRTVECILIRIFKLSVCVRANGRFFELVWRWKPVDPTSSWQIV